MPTLSVCRKGQFPYLGGKGLVDVRSPSGSGSKHTPGSRPAVILTDNRDHPWNVMVRYATGAFRFGTVCWSLVMSLFDRRHCAITGALVIGLAVAAAQPSHADSTNAPLYEACQPSKPPV